MSVALIRADTLYAWRGPSLLVTTLRGECDDAHPLSGFYYRETRVLRTFRIEINGERPWLTESALTAPERIDFTYVHPEITQPGGGGTGQSGDEEGIDAYGLPDRALDMHVSCTTAVTGLEIVISITNRHRAELSFDLRCVVDADFADIQEGIADHREQVAPVRATSEGETIMFAYGHDDLPFHSTVRGDGWEAATRSAGRQELPAHVEQRPRLRIVSAAGRAAGRMVDAAGGYARVSSVLRDVMR